MATPRRMGRGARGALALALAAAALAGCGNAEEQQLGTSASAADRVQVEVRPDGAGGRVQRTTIECTSLTEQCRRLREADFDEPAPGICTQVYGGPAVATVTGRAGGRAIQAEFDLANGCRIDRWREFGWLLGDPPGQ